MLFNANISKMAQDRVMADQQ